MKIKEMFLVGLALVASVTIHAAPNFSVGSGSPNYFTFGGTNFVAVDDVGTVAYPGTYGNLIQNTPMVTYINAQSDLASAKFTLWYANSAGQPTITTNITTAVTINSTNGIGAGLPVVIAHTNSVDEVRIVSSITSSNFVYTTNALFPNAITTNLTYTITLNSAPTYPVNVGEQIFGYVPVASIAWGAATNSITGGYLLAGQYQTPMLMSLNFTSAGAIGVVSGVFQ